MPNTLPVTLLTGFLGSGKTTLLNRMLEDPGMKNAAVIVNEFGAMAVDNDLVHKGTERYMLTSTGCLCCTATSDIRTSLYELDQMVQTRAVPPFDRVVIETTGLADPAPIVNSLIPGGAPATGLRDHVVARRFHLSKIVATLDAEMGSLALGRHHEARKQIGFADAVAITKADLAPDAVARLGARVSRLNPQASVYDTNRTGFMPTALVGTVSEAYAPAGAGEDIAKWLSGNTHHHSHSHSHDDNHDYGDRHDGVSALQLSASEPLNPKSVDAFLGVMTSQFHAGLLRMKGLLALADDPTRPLVVHAVQHRLYPTRRLDGWPGDDTRSRMVLIGTDMPAEPIRRYFSSLIKPEKPWWRITA